MKIIYLTCHCSQMTAMGLTWSQDLRQVLFSLAAIQKPSADLLTCPIPIGYKTLLPCDIAQVLTVLNKINVCIKYKVLQLKKQWTIFEIPIKLQKSTMKPSKAAPPVLSCKLQNCHTHKIYNILSLQRCSPSHHI